METLQEILEAYNIDTKILYYFKEDLDSLSVKNIDKILSFLINNNVSSKTIENCPSILSGEFNDIKINYEYLKKEGFNISKINNCIHILIENPESIKNTLKYLREHYDDALINKKLSILSKDINDIKEIEKSLKKYDNYDDLLLSIIIDSNENINYDQIFKICNIYNVKVNSKIFKHSFDNLKEKLELSKDLNIPFSNYMLSSISDNIK